MARLAQAGAATMSRAPYPVTDSKAQKRRMAAYLRNRPAPGGYL